MSQTGGTASGVRYSEVLNAIELDFEVLGLCALALSPAFAANHTATVNTVQIFGTIDPAKISDYTDYMASANLYDGLANVDPKGNLVPELAENWDVSPDATSVTFHLRADAKFQDGSPVQAEDVVYSVERLLKINQGPANLFAGVLKAGSVEAVDAEDGQVQPRRRPSRRSWRPCRRSASSIPSSSRPTPAPTTARPSSPPMSRAPAPTR